MRIQVAVAVKIQYRSF